MCGFLRKKHLTGECGMFISVWHQKSCWPEDTTHGEKNFALPCTSLGLVDSQQRWTFLQKEYNLQTFGLWRSSTSNLRRSGTEWPFSTAEHQERGNHMWDQRIRLKVDSFGQSKKGGRNSSDICGPVMSGWKWRQWSSRRLNSWRWAPCCSTSSRHPGTSTRSWTCLSWGTKIWSSPFRTTYHT